MGPQYTDSSLHPYFTCMWTNSDHPSGGRNNLRLQPHLPCANDLRYFWPADQGRQLSLDVWGPHAVSTQYWPIQ